MILPKTETSLGRKVLDKQKLFNCQLLKPRFELFGEFHSSYCQSVIGIQSVNNVLSTV